MTTNQNHQLSDPAIRNFYASKAIKSGPSRIILEGEAELLDGTTAPRKLVCFVEHILPLEAPVPECKIPCNLPVWQK